MEEKIEQLRSTPVSVDIHYQIHLFDVFDKSELEALLIEYGSIEEVIAALRHNVNDWTDKITEECFFNNGVNIKI